jgi:hypothetical protein
MATGISSTQADAILNAYCRSVTYSDPVGFFIKLHIGDPGAAGTSNAAGNTTRKAVTFSASSGGVCTTSALIQWLAVSTTETYTHCSFWDTVGPAGGNFLGSDSLNTPRSVVSGGDFEIAAGQLTVTLGSVAA